MGTRCGAGNKLPATLIMSSKQVIILVFLGLGIVCLAEKVCKNNSKWCHWMTQYGACSWNNGTKKTCPLSCGLCKVTCPNTKPSERQECGYYGITQLDCYHKGCCWSPLEHNSKYPWCFKPSESIFIDPE